MREKWAGISVNLHTSTNLHGGTSHETVIFVVTTGIALNLTIHTYIAIRSTRNATAHRNQTHEVSTTSLYFVQGHRLKISSREISLPQ